MSTLWSVLATLPLLADETPAPEDVKAGWLGFTVFLLLVAAVALLGLSLRKHLGRVKFEEKPDGEKDAGDDGGQTRTSNGSA